MLDGGAGAGRAGSRCPLALGWSQLNPVQPSALPLMGCVAISECPSVTIGLSVVTVGSIGALGASAGTRVVLD